MNSLLFLVISSISQAGPLERLQAALFVDVFRIRPGESAKFVSGQASAEDPSLYSHRGFSAPNRRANYSMRWCSNKAVQGLYHCLATVLSFAWNVSLRVQLAPHQLMRW